MGAMNEATTILLVDDDPSIREMIEIYLKNEGYEVLHASTGREALKMVKHHSIDCILLDMMMPEMDGLEACVEIRKREHMPIIFLTAKSEDLDKITGLTVGADDYVTKPFHPLELVARVKSQIRRYKHYASKPASPEHRIVLDDLVIDRTLHQVTIHGENISLTPREFAILDLMASHPGQVFSIEQIYEKVWKEPFWEGNNNTVMVHIRKIREKIEKNPRKPQYLKTVWGVGYKIDHPYP